MARLEILNSCGGDEIIPLVQLPARLQEFTGRSPPTYEQCYKAILNSRFPAERFGRQHGVRARHLAMIAETFGLTPIAA